MSAIDLVISFYRLLNVPTVTGLLLGGKVWRYQRPLNSDKVDVIISVPEYVGGSFNVADVEINVYAPNLKNFEPIGHPDPTHPDVVRLKAVTEVILSILDGYSVKVAGKLIQDKSGVWYSNIVVQVEQIDDNLSIPVTVMEIVGLSDGFGGMTVTYDLVWSGQAAQVNIADGSQLSSMGAKYDLNLKSDWIIPRDDVTPQKDMEIRTGEGAYIINGIKPLGRYWQVSTYRKDAPYV